jgi:hypothetical protein
LSFGDAFAPDESVLAPDDAAVLNAPILNGTAPGGSATNDDNTTHQASDPDPPDGKAA